MQIKSTYLRTRISCPLKSDGFEGDEDRHPDKHINRQTELERGERQEKEREKSPVIQQT